MTAVGSDAAAAVINYAMRLAIIAAAGLPARHFLVAVRDALTERVYCHLVSVSCRAASSRAAL